MGAYDLSDPASKREYNRRLFRVVATRYDAITRVLSFWQDHSWKQRLLETLPEGDLRRIVDLACGTGDLTEALARRYPSAEITGVDLSPEMLARARRRLKAAAVRFVEADMGELPLSDGSVNLVTGGYAVRNAPDLEALLREVKRVLAPGGLFVILDFSHSHTSLASTFQIGLLRFWGRLWGALLHGNPEVYGYIAESLRRFPSRPELEKRLRQAGFRRVRSRSFFFGLIAITRGRR